VTAGLVWRLVDLTILDRAFLQGQGNARTLRTVDISAHRGMITDRNGAPLAISSPVVSIWINPKEFNANSKQLESLSKLLTLQPKGIQSRSDKNAKREFVYLKRGLEPSIGEAVKELSIPGVYYKSEYRRFYPEAEATSHVLGFTNVDDHGQEGMELALDKWLVGLPGSRQVLKDRYGHVVQEIKTIREPHAGKDLTLSLDRRIQYTAYKELKEGVEKYQAKNGSVVVLDVHTGEVLALVNYPSYNPNGRTSGQDALHRNRAVTDLFEPGSTMKTFSVVNALLKGKYNPLSKIDTSPGWMLVDGKRISDTHPQGIIDLTTILKKSSNMGISKVTLSIPQEQFRDVMNKVGFGETTGSGFPGESEGTIAEQNPWPNFVHATLSFGYGLSTTALQITRAYSILGNHGVKVPVTFLKQDTVPSGEKVLSDDITKQLLQMMESVVEQGGTAPWAKVPGFKVTGKTGTSWIHGPKGYEKHHYYSSFIGMAPAKSPKLAIGVIINDPRVSLYYGGYTAGPIFSKIMGTSLRLLNVLPEQ